MTDAAARYHLPPDAEEQLERSSCAYFAFSTLRGPPEAPYCGRYLVSRHHEEWDELVHAHDRLCVLAPRDHGKTYFFDFAYPLWKAAYNPGGRGYIFSATQDQAIRILSDIKDELEDNPKLAHLVPKYKEAWSKTSIKLANGHRIYARGFGTKIRGAHPHWIVVDDGLNDEDAYSELIRNKHIDYFFTAISNMIVPGGQLIVVGTPFHANDLYAELEKNKAYVFRKFPALNKDDEPLWPDRYDKKRLQDKREEIGPIRFTREFLCEPISDDMSIFPARLFVGDPVEQYTARLGEAVEQWRERGVTSVFIGVDLAISTSVGADFFVVFVLGLDQFGNRWVLDIFRKAGMPYQQQLSIIQAYGKLYDADLIFIEANQLQSIVGDELIRLTDLPIKKFVTTGSGKGGVKHPTSTKLSANKNALDGGVPALRVLLENQKFRIPRGDERSIRLTDHWISEMKAFTWLDGKLQGVGAKDDCVMALWIADQAVRAGAFSFGTGEEEGGDSVEDIIREQTEDPDDGVPENTQSAVEREKAAVKMIRQLEGGGPADAGEEDGEDDELDGLSNLVDESDAGAGGVDVVALSVWARLPGLAGSFR